jgi:pimeloyl-ACP methyl ester carboxylesterase
LLIYAPNHGRSAWTEEFSYPLVADLIADKLDELDAFAHPMILVGHSMGGKLAMRLTLDHPELVQALVVVDVSPAASSEARDFLPYIRAMLSIDLTKLRDRSQADAALSQAVPDRTVRDFLLQNLHRRPAGATRPGEEEWYWQVNLPLLRDSLPTIAGWDDPGTQWAGPVLWIRGGRSNYVRPEHGQAMTKLFPNHRLVTIPDAGHWVHSEAPEEFVTLLRDFISPLPIA